jgi:6-pyruvoyltetrahydropterin/6-carboxytetrahydropterin synthase
MTPDLTRAYFGRRYTLSASHRLHTETLTAAENLATYGKCNNPHGHGHNYIGEVDAETGMVVNMVALDEAVQKCVIERFDHANLNLDPLFVNRVPTTENLCRAVFELLDGSVEPAQLVRVRVEETENNFFEYAGQ